MARGGVAHGGDGLDVRPAHQAFCIHVRVEELVAIRLEGPDGVHGGEGQDGLPAVNHHPAAATVHGGDHTLPADAVAQEFRELEVRYSVNAFPTVRPNSGSFFGPKRIRARKKMKIISG
jgi:hypothetical protein